MNEPTAQPMKWCPCAEHVGPNPLPLSEFHKNRAQRDGLSIQCKACNKSRVRKWQRANPGKVLAKQRELAAKTRATNPQKLRNKLNKWRAENPEKSREQYRRSNSRRWAALRAAVFDHYGWTCACCGSAERPTIDHVNGGGSQHRAEIGEGADRTYRWLIANGFPEGFQTLCWRCNMSKKDTPACRLDHSVTSTGPAEPSSVS